MDAETEDPSQEASQTIGLFTPWQIAVGGLFGSGALGCLFVSFNFKRMGNFGMAKAFLWCTLFAGAHALLHPSLLAGLLFSAVLAIFSRALQEAFSIHSNVEIHPERWSLVIVWCAITVVFWVVLALMLLAGFQTFSG